MELKASTGQDLNPLGLQGWGAEMGWGWMLTSFSSPRPGALSGVKSEWRVALATGVSRPGMNMDSAHTSCVTLGKLLHLPEPQCFHLLTRGEESHLLALL